MSNTNDDTPDFGAIMSSLRKWYYAEIHSLVDEAIKECVKHHDADDDEDARREWMDTWLHETIDGHEFVIYTMKAKCALLASDNEDAMEEELGESGTSEQRCYFAMRRDAMQLLSAREDEWATPPCPNPDCPTHLDVDAEHVDGVCDV